MGLDMFLTVKRDGERLDAAFWHNAYDICVWFETNLKSVADGTGYGDPDDWEPGAELDPPKKGECENNYYYPVTKKEFNRLLKVCRDALAAKEHPNKIPKEIQPDALKDDMDSYWEHITHTIEQLEDVESEIDWKNDTVEFMASY